VAAPTSGAVIGVLLLILLLAVLLIVFVRYYSNFSLSQTLIVCVSITQGGGEVTEDQ
jgi:TRAP-type C4-dicarboxylate transport system permease small subunit